MCRDASQKGKLNRVTKENFLLLKKLPQYKCTEKNVTKSVCVCPKSYGDFQCSTQLYKKCLINITDPAFYKGCSDKNDTPSYFYSVPGYDPCFFLNFSRSYEVIFNLHCKVIDEHGLNDIERETSGY
jgi:hypothetical protein